MLHVIHLRLWTIGKKSVLIFSFNLLEKMDYGDNNEQSTQLNNLYMF